MFTIMFTKAQKRIVILTVMVLTLVTLMVATVWQSYSLVHQIRALEKQMARLNDTTLSLQQEYSTLRSQSAALNRANRFSVMQQNNLPDYQRPNRLWRMDQIPFLSEAPIVISE